jgi:16S rRNA (guanine527-N7)-methyltransferase
MNKETFIKELNHIGINIDEEKLNQLETYYDMLIEYNNHTNLTRITEKEEVYLKHFYDSLTLIKAIKLDSQSILDVGTGAGFPGLVLKIVFPTLDITLVDSLNKRITFLNSVIEKLKLKNIKAIHARAEEYVKENKETFDIVTSRAVANLQVLSELCIPAVKVNGYFIPMKADANEEIANARNAIKLLGGKLDDNIIFDLPNNEGLRTLIKIKKISNTSVKYPRKFNEIKKNPL